MVVISLSAGDGFDFCHPDLNYVTYTVVKFNMKFIKNEFEEISVSPKTIIFIKKLFVNKSGNLKKVLKYDYFFFSHNRYDVLSG